MASRPLTRTNLVLRRFLTACPMKLPMIPAAGFEPRVRDDLFPAPIGGRVYGPFVPKSRNAPRDPERRKLERHFRQVRVVEILAENRALQVELEVRPDLSERSLDAALPGPEDEHKLTVDAAGPHSQYWLCSPISRARRTGSCGCGMATPARRRHGRSRSPGTSWSLFADDLRA